MHGAGIKLGVKPAGGDVLTRNLMAMLLMAELLMAGAASASGPDCLDCCKQAGLVGCPTQIRVHGPGSHVSRESGAWRVSGLWRMDCDGGATYDDGATVALAQRPLAGQIMRLASPAVAVACFAQSCTLPASGCIREAADTGQFTLVRCSDNQMLSETEMRARGTEPAAPAPTAAPPPTAPPPTATPGTLDLTLPAPATRCASGEALLEAAQTQVNSGAIRLQDGQLAQAANSYRAALTIDPCSAGGWAGLGAVALQSRDHTTAIQALKAATGLQPKVPSAWVLLGQAYHGSGQNDAAIEALDMALEAAPDHAEARSLRDRLLAAE
jgi:hypothetical protein